jgi:hypothetical protein
MRQLQCEDGVCYLDKKPSEVESQIGSGGGYLSNDPEYLVPLKGSTKKTVNHKRKATKPKQKFGGSNKKSKKYKKPKAKAKRVIRKGASSNSRKISKLIYKYLRTSAPNKLKKSKRK